MDTARLWVLGDRLRSALFCNAIMRLMCDIYGGYIHEGGQWISSVTLDYIYDSTCEGSVLREFAKDLVLSDGPISERALTYQEDPQAHRRLWEELILRGGDAVRDVATERGFSNDGDYYSPYAPHRQAKYKIVTHGRDLQNFVIGRKRQDTAWLEEVVWQWEYGTVQIEWTLVVLKPSRTSL